MSPGIFITGTDTGVGKTVMASAVIRRLARSGRRVAGMKPVATGCASTADGLRNDDALALAAASTVKLPYELLNPYAFEPAIAPHIAAADSDTAIDLQHLIATYRSIASRVDIVVVEGAGGWRVPLFPDGYLSDLPEALELSVILVVGLRLGCLNHAVMTAELIARGNAKLAGWIGNRIDPDFARAAENIATLRRLLPAPCLGIVPHLADPNDAASHLDLDSLLP